MRLGLWDEDLKGIDGQPNASSRDVARSHPRDAIRFARHTDAMLDADATHAAPRPAPLAGSSNKDAAKKVVEAFHVGVVVAGGTHWTALMRLESLPCFSASSSKLSPM